MKKSILAAGVIFMMLVASDTFAQKTKFQSMFVYNFCKYIKWPSYASTGEFVIGTLGNAPISKELENMVTTKKEIGGRAIVYKNFNSIEEIQNCNILFISDKFLSDIQKISAATSSKGTLLITEKTGMAKAGAHINFVEQDGKIRFELNKASAERDGLKVSTSLADLAILL